MKLDRVRFRHLRRQYRRTRRENTRLIDQLRNAKSFRLGLDFQAILSVISVVAPVFLVSGVLYCFVLFRQFGLHIDDYLVVGDYLNGSVGRIGYAAFVILINFIGLFLRINAKTRQTRYEQRIARPLEITVSLVGHLTFLLLFTALLVSDLGRFLDLAPVLLLPYIHILSFWLAMRFFKTPNRSYLALVATLALVVSAVFGALETGYGTMNGTKDQKVIVFADASLQNLDLRPFFRSQDYHFFFEPNEEKTYVVDREDIVRVEVPRP